LMVELAPHCAVELAPHCAVLMHYLGRTFVLGFK
jgi:hypothetical protein